VLFDKLDEFMLEFEQHDKEIKSGVVVVGDAAAYALVWEYGNKRQHKQGPRTVIGTNPKGDMEWMSSQAPFGYIRVHERDYMDAVMFELGRAKFDQPDAAAMTRELEKRASNASKLIAEIIKDSAPHDSWDLAHAIKVVDASDPILDLESDNFETLLVENAE